MKTIFIFVIFCAAILFLIFYNSTKDRCFTSFECQWKITNCCPETSGANWECVNVKSYNETKCPKFVICPQFLSPRPNLSCDCENGECVVK